MEVKYSYKYSKRFKAKTMYIRPMMYFIIDFGGPSLSLLILAVCLLKSPLMYRPFHKTLPRSSASINWFSAKVLWNRLYFKCTLDGNGEVDINEMTAIIGKIHTTFQIKCSSIQCSFIKPEICSNLAGKYNYTHNVIFPAFCPLFE